ncbi:MAG: hypothetical protein WCX97_03990 [Candidatus Magasanikbacteria bacterium]
MKNILIAVTLFILLGTGCTKNTQVQNSDAGLNYDGQGNPKNMYSDVELKQNFCTEQKEAAEKIINAYKISDEQRPFFEVWKKLFIKYNDITEQDFNNRVFVYGIDKITDSFGENDYSQFVFHLYIKAGDFYLARGSSYELPDNFIKTKNSDLEYVETLPNEYITKYLAERCLKQYDDWCKFGWNAGGQKLSFATLENVPTCAEATKLLRTCQSNILPQYVSYLPQMLNKLSITGVGKGDNFCKVATLNLATKKMVACEDCGPADLSL